MTGQEAMSDVIFKSAIRRAGTPLWWAPSALLGFDMDHIEGGLLFGH
jgi:hypothetical protein